MQRTGTTSTGKFFRDLGLKSAGWNEDKKNNWSGAFHDGDLESIFASDDFLKSDAFEDSPWFGSNLYRVLYHRFPGSKFILLERDPDAWLRSMVSHSGGSILGRSRTHCRIYRRELEYYSLLNSEDFDETIENTIGSQKKMKILDCPGQYKEIYKLHSIEVKDFFARLDPSALFVGRLEDPEKWKKLGTFLNKTVPSEYNSHENASRKSGQSS